MTISMEEHEFMVNRAVGLMAHYYGFRAADRALERARHAVRQARVDEVREGIRARLRRVAERENVPLEALLGDSRKSRLCWLRWEIWHGAHDDDGFSLPMIGAVFNRDHTTILHGVRKYRALMKIAASQEAAA